MLVVTQWCREPTCHAKSSETFVCMICLDVAETGPSCCVLVVPCFASLYALSLSAGAGLGDQVQ